MEKIRRFLDFWNAAEDSWKWARRLGAIAFALWVSVRSERILPPDTLSTALVVAAWLLMIVALFVSVVDVVVTVRKRRWGDVAEREIAPNGRILVSVRRMFDMASESPAVEERLDKEPYLNAEDIERNAKRREVLVRQLVRKFIKTHPHSIFKVLYTDLVEYSAFVDAEAERVIARPGNDGSAGLPGPSK